MQSCLPGGPVLEEIRLAGVARAGICGCGQWVQANRPGDGSLPTGKEIGSQYGQHERWDRLIKRSG